MCGIIGYIGSKKTTDVLIDGLKALEYRGYDSAGIAISDGVNKEVIKSIGRVSNLEKKIKKESKITASYGIAHTRWATNGKPTLVNAHPHSNKNVTLVHNGIIENSDILRDELIKDGYSFKSETDTEVIAVLLSKKLESLDILEAIKSLTKELIGSYALVIMIDNYECLYALRKDSPLIIGLSKEEFFAASDITAISNYTNKFILLDEGEIAIIKKDGVTVKKDGKQVEKAIHLNESILNDTSKMGYDHFMLKEIMEEPTVLENLFNKYLDDDKLDLSKYKEISIVGCGSAMYAGLIGKNLLEEYASIKTDVECASEFRYKRKIFNNKKESLVILISQSGETADTVAALREANLLGVDTLGIVNNPNSTIARECKNTILTDGGVEIAVATTKAYILQVAVLSLISIKTAIKKKLLDKSIKQEYKKTIPLLKKVLEKKMDYEILAKKISNIENCFYIGRGIDYAISMEASLKLKEVSYIHSEAYQAGELKHGTISLIEKDTVVFTVVTDKKLKDKTISNLKETESRGALGVIITTDSLDDNKDYLKIVVPNTKRFIQPLLVVPALQLLAYYIAKERSCDIDKPRNLAKSVTVE